MTFQAIVVVVRGEEDDTWSEVASALAGIEDVRFVGMPWLVQPLDVVDDEETFDTLGAIDQHPDK